MRYALTTSYDPAERRRTPGRHSVRELHLLVLNTLVFLFQYWVGRQSPPAAAAIVSQLGVVPARLSVVLFNHGYVPWDLVSQLSTRYVPPMAAILPLFTSMFLHGSWLHVIFNMWGLWIFGDNVEDSVGHACTWCSTLTCGVAAALFHTLFNTSSTVPSGRCQWRHRRGHGRLLPSVPAGARADPGAVLLRLLHVVAGMDRPRLLVRSRSS